MATRLFYVATFMLAVSWDRSTIITADQQDDSGRCEKITIPLCTGMKYNMTRMPNLVGIANQNDAALQVRADLHVTHSRWLQAVDYQCSTICLFVRLSVSRQQCA